MLMMNQVKLKEETKVNQAKPLILNLKRKRKALIFLSLTKSQLKSWPN